MPDSSNPFEVTKAVDFTDAQIEATWVDLPGGGFEALADPRSPMPRFLVGGKGGGRTHLLRYFSYALQRLRHAEDPVAGVQADGYVGIYFRCGGLNSSRFAGKRQGDETWAAVFAYYTEVWLGRLTVDLIADLHRVAPAHVLATQLERFASDVLDLFDIRVTLDTDSTDAALGLSSGLRQLQRELDVAINNAALTHSLDIQIGASPGRLAFGVPSAAQRHIPAFANVAFAYLFDEFENLTREQQQYINTLLREKELPSTFLVGSRLFGLRTHMTLSAGEENRQGSEFEQVVLEEAYRATTHKYRDFCREIVMRRLMAAGCDVPPGAKLTDYFESVADGASLEQRATLRVHERPAAGGEPPWRTRLRSQLETHGIREQVAAIIASVSVDDSPLHEKFAILLLYRAWADNKELATAATEIRGDVETLIDGRDRRGKVATSYKHYRHDLYAQLLRELGYQQEYFGFDDFVAMSGYLPRNLLVVLKQVTRWADFLGERPFRGAKISLQAQREGVREASSWFLSDAKGLGEIGEQTQGAMRRLASLFREMRFTDKPVEVSCSAFSTDRQGLSAGALKCLDEAISHSLLLTVPVGRRDKNSHVLHHKYQLNPMLAPLFELAVASRGSIALSATELTGVFDPTQSEQQFDRARRRIIERMQAPFSIDPPPQESLGI